MVAKESPLRSSSEALIIWMVNLAKQEWGTGSVEDQQRFEFEELSGHLLFEALTLHHLCP